MDKDEMVTITTPEGSMEVSRSTLETNEKMRKYFRSLPVEEQERFEHFTRKKHPYIKNRVDLYCEAARYAWAEKNGHGGSYIL